MLLTSRMIDNMPDKLKAFSKYIEKYDCTFTSGIGAASLLFYNRNTQEPYVSVMQIMTQPYVSVYVKENSGKQDISNDMNSFLKAIRECRESSHVS